jgi:eukaryotic-like serine/threonine-protein kinase
MQNSFNFQQSITDISQFYGRKTLINKIYSRIGASRPQSVSIVGDYKSGKTSLLLYLSHPSIQQQYFDDVENYFCLFLPVSENTNSLEEFVSYLCQAVSKIVSIDFEYISIMESYNWFKQIVETKTGENKKFIFFMDDFNLITQNEAFPLEFFSFLRSLANNFNVAYVTSSYLDLQQLCVSKDVEESPFFNIFTNITMRPFDPEETESFMVKFAFNGKELPLAEREMVLKFAGPFPYLLQLAGYILAGHNYNQADFKKDFSDKAEDYFKKIWKQLDEDYKKIMVLVILSRKISNAQNYMVQELIQKNYIFQKNRKLYIFSPAFSQFIARQNNIRSSNFFMYILNKITQLFKTV